jgi:hypothetical protein
MSFSQGLLLSLLMEQQIPSRKYVGESPVVVMSSDTHLPYFITACPLNAVILWLPYTCLISVKKVHVFYKCGELTIGKKQNAQR